MSLTEEVFQLERENIHRKGFITNPKIILKAYRTVISHNSNPVRDHRKFEGSDQPRTTIGGSKFSHNSSPSIIFLAVKLPLILFVKAKFPQPFCKTAEISYHRVPMPMLVQCLPSGIPFHFSSFPKKTFKGQILDRSLLKESCTQAQSTISAFLFSMWPIFTQLQKDTLSFFK